MKKIILVVLALAAIGTARAQEYNWGVGVRGGGVASGVTVKYFLDGANALEGIVDFVHGVNVYALYERHLPVIAQGFNFYYGAGANLGGWKSDAKYDPAGNRYYDYPFTVGVDGVIGLEYKVPEVPLAVGVDYKPCINLFGESGFKWYDFGMSVRVLF